LIIDYLLFINVLLILKILFIYLFIIYNLLTLFTYYENRPESTQYIRPLNRFDSEQSVYPSVATFRRHLKKHLFRSSYYTS